MHKYLNPGALFLRLISNNTCLGFQFTRLFAVFAFCLLAIRPAHSQETSYDPPIGQRIALFNKGGSAYVTLGGEEGLLTAKAESAHGHMHHFMVEDVGDGSGYIRLKSVRDGLYVTRQQFSNGNYFLYATVAEQDKLTTDTRLEWIEDADGLDIKFVGTGQYARWGNAGKIRIDSNGAAGRFSWHPSGREYTPKLRFRMIPEDERWPTFERIMAAAELTDRVDPDDPNSPSLFGLPDDPSSEDCSYALEAAIEHVARGGGGTVFIPEGMYLIERPIILRENVQIRGRWCAPYDGTDDLGYTYAQKLGTVIKVEYSGEDPLLRASTLQDLTFWHSAQDPEAGITPYSWTVTMGGGAPKAYYHRLTFLNTNQGVYINDGSAGDAGDIYGCAYEVGIRVNPNYALAQFTNFNFSPEYLEWAGLASGSALEAHRAAARLSGSAIEMSRVGVGSYVRGHRVGFTTFAVDNQGNAPLNKVGGVTIEDCEIGVLFNSGRPSWTLSKSTISDCDYAVQAPTGGKLNIEKSELQNSLLYDVYVEDSEISLDVAVLEGSVANIGKMKLNGGVVDDTAFVEEEVVDEIESELDERIETELVVPDYGADSRDLLVWDIFDVTEDRLADPSDPTSMVPGAVGDGLVDDTLAIQTAIAAANANGGGVVMFPGGHYRVTENLIDVGPGVELRGALDWRVLQNIPELGTYLWPDVQDYADDEENEEAFIRLGDNSGVRGMSFFYPGQVGTSPFKRYPYTIQGNGYRNYVIYCTGVNPYRFINFNGDENLLSLSFPSASKNVLFVNGTQDGRFIRNNPKPFWTGAFPRNGSEESYNREITKEGMVLLHLKDSDNYGSPWGSYCHAGYLGLKVENSGGNIGRISFEAFRNGHLFVSGDKEMIIADKNSSRQRPGPVDGEDSYYMKLEENFTGKVISHSSGPEGDFTIALHIKNGTYHKIGGDMRDQKPQVIVVEEKGSLILERVNFRNPVMLRNEGSVKLIGNTGLNGLPYPYAKEFETDNEDMEVATADIALGFSPHQEFGLQVNESDLYFSPSQEFEGQPYTSGTTRIATNKIDITVDEAAFFNSSEKKVEIVFEGFVIAGSTLQLSYYSEGAFVSLAEVAYTEDKDRAKFTLENPSFGEQLPEHADLPDIRLSVLAGDSPRLRWIRLSTDLPGNPVFQAIDDLRVANTPAPYLTWSAFDNVGTRYNVYRRGTASGAFGDPIATVTEPYYIDTEVEGDPTVYTYVVTSVNPQGYESAISFDSTTNWPEEPVAFSRSLPTAFIYRDYAATSFLARGQYPFSWSLVEGALPAGLTLSGEGTLSGQAIETGTFSFTLEVVDGDGGEQGRHTYSMAVVQNLPLFVEDFEDDTVDLINEGLAFRDDDDGLREDRKDFGRSYRQAGEYIVTANPERVANESPHAVLLNNMDGGTENTHFIDGIFEKAYPVHGLEFSFDFYHTSVDDSNLKDDDALRFYLVGVNESSSECQIIFPRNQIHNPDDGGQIMSLAAPTDAWHRFSGRFSETEVGGEFLLEWTLENLEGGLPQGGGILVDLNDGEWASNGLDTSHASGIRLFTNDVDNSQGYHGYFDNVRVTYRPPVDSPDPVQILTQSLPEALQHSFYLEKLEASGEYPFTWSLMEGSLPPGLTLYPDGTLRGLPNSGSIAYFTVQVTDRNGNTATQDLSTSSLRTLVFFDDFEDDFPLYTTNSGLGIRTDVEEGGLDKPDLGASYSNPVGEYEIRNNPESAGNVSEQVLFLNQIGDGTPDNHYVNALFSEPTLVDGLEVKFDFYNTQLSDSDLHSGDAVRLYLVGSDNNSIESEIRLHRNGDFKIEESNAGATPVQNAWQRFTGYFRARDASGSYDLHWTLSNLETGDVARGTQIVNLADGEWAANALDTGIAYGIQIHVYDRKNRESYLAFVDNVSASSGSTIPASDRFAAWMYGNPNLSFSQVDPLANLDGGILNNLHEYAFGGDTTDSNDDVFFSPAMALDVNNDEITLTYSYLERKDALERGLYYIVEHTVGLDDLWLKDGVTVTERTSFNEEMDWVTVSIPESSSDKQFIRLQIGLFE
ncbi:MAG: glycosyl hydrolase family 28-related protein [Opitutales bacterium]